MFYKKGDDLTHDEFCHSCYRNGRYKDLIYFVTLSNWYCPQCFKKAMNHYRTEINKQRKKRPKLNILLGILLLIFYYTLIPWTLWRE